jgi:hypothetical protein
MHSYFAFLLSVVVLTALPAPAAETNYFPKGEEKWFPKHLMAMKEPSLYEQRADTSIQQYRFLWLRTFHKPIAIRIKKDNAGMTLRVVRLSGAGGYEPGRIEHDVSMMLTTNQWDGFIKLLEKSSFWKLPADEADINARGADGSEWVLEGQATGQYHVVDRWTPASDTDKRHLEDFITCCRYLLNLSKEEIPKKDDY